MVILGQRRRGGKKIKESKAKLLFVIILQKENSINKWKDELGVEFVMGVGGTFDVISGKVKGHQILCKKLAWNGYLTYARARRMWKRYLYTNTVYLFLLFKEFLRV